MTADMHPIVDFRAINLAYKLDDNDESMPGGVASWIRLAI
jgi:hypothetical protein